MLQPDISKLTVDKVQLPFIEKKRVDLEMLRLDKIHPVISGNKWFKLKYHLENFHSGKYRGILSFGGAWSNHIVATACACFYQNIKCTGIIRSEKPNELSHTLNDAMNFKMDLKFISREMYRQKNTDEFLLEIKNEYPDYYIIPEGGTGDDGEKGAGEILNLVDKKYYSHIACAIGTATMFRGIAKTINRYQQVMGIPVIKGFNEIQETATAKIFPGYHFGGYAKYNDKLINFMNDFFRQSNIPTDFIYTGKLVFAVCDLIKKDFFSPGSRILLIHSGGLQGNSSLPKGTLIF